MSSSAASRHILPYLPSSSGRADGVLPWRVKSRNLCFRRRGVYFGGLFWTTSKVYQKNSSFQICSAENRHQNDKHNQFDEQVLEKELQIAIKTENYAEAVRLRDKLRTLQDDNKAAVIAANTKFYRAFELGDLRMMRSVWAPGENVHCIHPGAGRISGYDMVIASWEIMLGPETGLPLKIELQNLEVQVKGGLAYVTCLEVVRTQGSSWGKQLATNIFEKQNGNWYICVHHASHITV